MAGRGVFGISEACFFPVMSLVLHSPWQLSVECPVSAPVQFAGNSAPSVISVSLLTPGRPSVLGKDLFRPHCECTSLTCSVIRMGHLGQALVCQSCRKDHVTPAFSSCQCNYGLWLSVQVSRSLVIPIVDTVTVLQPLRQFLDLWLSW